MKKFFYLFFLVSYLGFSQNEANIWYFGNNAGLDFNSGSPVALTDSAMQTLEGCASISNANGELLFYTDGSTVWNKNHVPMLNGTGLNGSFYSTQSAIIVPKPNATSIYYVFTVYAFGNPNGLQYSEVDMTLDGGLGGITSNKNILLFTPVLEKLTAVEHSNGNDIWVIAHENGSANFRSYLVTSSGVQTSPVLTNIGFTYSGNSSMDNAGYMKLSHCGDRLAMVFPVHIGGLHLFDFDNNTGVLSNHINVYDNQNSGKLYGVEFSPSDQLLYVSGQNGVVQLNIMLDTSFEIYSSFVYIHQDNFYSKWGALQLAPDNKIYVTRDPNDNFPDLNTISVINDPDILGTGCNFQLDAIPLGIGIAQRGLPQFIKSFFNINISSSDNCFGEATQFSYESCGFFDSIVWDFGDGNSSTEDNPQHTYNTPGTYTVSVTVSSNGETTTDTQQITIYEQPVANPIPDQIRCVESPFFTYTYDLTIHDNDILNGQDPNQFILEYYSDISSYNNTDPIDNPQMIELMVGGSADFVVSIQNVSNSECEDYTVIHVDVYQSPEINTNITNLSVCDDDSVGTANDGLVIIDLTQIEPSLLNSGSPSGIVINYFADENFVNLINNPENYQNSNSTETIYVEVFDSSLTECKSTTSFTLDVEPKPVIQSNVDFFQCDSDLDGISIFNLSDVEPEISTDNSSLFFSYHETFSNATNGINPIIDAETYQNVVPNTDTVWARVENDTDCFSIAEITLNVSSTQIPINFMLDLYQCEVSAESGISTFDLTSANYDILALFPSNQSIEVTYYQNENDALSDINPLLNIASYQNASSPVTQNIYIRVENTLNNDCSGLGHHITLHVEPIPAQTGPYIFEQCDDGGDGIEFFDTSGIESTLSSLQNGDISITYEDEFGTPLPSPLPNPLEVTIPIYNVFATMTFENPNITEGGCSNVESIAFAINNATNIVQPQPFSACDEDGDGIFTFDTSGLEQNMVPDLDDSIDIIYEDEEENVISSPFPDSFTTATQTITAFITADNEINADCVDVVQIEFFVTAQPTANVAENIFICDDPSNDGVETLSLSDFDTEILSGQGSDIFEVSYFENSTDAENNINPLPNNYQVVENNQMIYARIQHNENQDCFDISSFEISINYLPVAYMPEKLIVCDTQVNDQVEEFDLTLQDNAILNDQLAVENAISYYTTLADAENNTNAINGLHTNANNPQTIYARIENINAPNCFSITSFEIEVFDSPELDIAEEVILCENESLTISIDDIYDDYLWSTGETSSSISINELGNYEISVFRNYEDFSCETTTSFEVISSNEALINDLTIVDWTQSNNAISILVEGNGDYEYSIDGVNYQVSNTFQNLTDYEYLVHVKDKNGCGETLRRVYLLDYPQFFTPNADGFNDRWQIINAKQEVFTKIYIFNRYGKLITDINPTSSGWDGTMNGKPMPSDDYWFRVEREDGRVLSGHFTLKR